MIDCAHASAYHWALAPECKPENRARSAWLISRAYTVAGRPDAGALPRRALLPALRALRRSATGISPMPTRRSRARASVAGDREAVGQYVELAQAVEIADDGDRKHLAGDLTTLR